MINRNIMDYKNNSPNENILKSHILLMKSESVNSFMIALIICANFIALILDSLGIVSSGIVPLIFGFSLIFSFGNSIFVSTKFKVSKKAFLLLLYILIAFSFSILFRGFNSAAYKYLIMFLAYGGIIFLVTLMNYDSYKIIKYTMIIGILFLINPLRIAGYSSAGIYMNGQISMGASYAFFPCVVAAIIHFFYYRKKIDFLIILGYLANVSLFFLLLKEGTRGVLLSLFILCFYIFFTKIGEKFSRTRKFKILFMGILFLIVFIILLLNLENILLYVYELMKGLGFEVSSIIKTYNLMQSEGANGILNGRGQIYANAFEMIKSSPLWGFGIGAYEDMYLIYPHNIFLQIFSEGGILLGLPISILVFQCLFKLLKAIINKEKNRKTQLLLLLFIISVPRLMISSRLWQEQAFWLLIFIFLARNDASERRIIND